MNAASYTPPHHPADSFTASATRPLDTLCFVINFTFATLFFIVCVIAIGAADNPFSFIGGFMLVLPVACYAIAEWICWYRKHHELTRPLGILNLLLAAFFVFGLVTTVGEVLMAEEPMDLWFILIFGTGFAIIAGYLAWCGWRRVRSIPRVSDTIPIDN
tara:strand:- start:2468 stop:2944 length:477 start_codon:yes stop_codon:yes gene_type:complete